MIKARLSVLCFVSNFTTYCNFWIFKVTKYNITVALSCITANAPFYFL